MADILAYWRDNFGEVLLEKNEKGEVAMLINGGLQFSSRDEYRYHQSLFLLPSLCFNRDINVLILGGGDGLGARELLAQSNVKSIDLVDISPFVITLAKHHPEMRKLNKDAFWNEKVNVIIEDGLKYVKETDKKYDLIILDYPDPSVEEDDPVNKLFTIDHFKDVKGILKEDGIVAMQSTSVAISPNVFRYLVLLQKQLYKEVVPLRINVSSFGDIGIILSSDKEIEILQEIPERAFFTKESIGTFMILHKDEMPDIPDEVLKERKIHEVIGYDLFTRGKENI